MGSGISLSQTQVVHIIKRDLLRDYMENINKRKPALTSQEIYYNCLADAQFDIINKKLNKILK